MSRKVESRPRGRRGPASPSSSPRRAARIAAVQALYQMELAGTPPDRVLREFASGGLAQAAGEPTCGTPDTELLSSLVMGVAAQRHELDNMISGVLSEDWTVERLESVLRAILRAGAYELSGRRDIPARVSIDEYVDIADAFFGGRQPAFVNGVLDRLARLLRPEELGTGNERAPRAR